MRAYMRQIEAAIAGAFVNDRLAIHLLGGVQGPHTLTFGVRLYQPTKSNVAKALSLAPAIEATTGVSPVRVYSESGAIMVELPSPQPIIIDGTRYAGEGLAIPLGMTGRRGIVGVDFVRNPHLLFVGPTGRGKTTAARVIAGIAVERFELYGTALRALHEAGPRRHSRIRFLGERVPFAAAAALAGPFAGGRAAVLADEDGLGFGHGAL